LYWLFYRLISLGAERYSFAPQKFQVTNQGVRGVRGVPNYYHVCGRSVPTYYHLFVGDPPPQRARAYQRSRIFAPYQSLSREIGDFQI